MKKAKPKHSYYRNIAGIALAAGGMSQHSWAVQSDEYAAPMFGIFENLPGVAAAASQGSSTLSMIDENDNWTPRPDSTWWSGNTLDEADVFHAELQHSSSTETWGIRIGKGGQLYSWNVSGVGEILPKCGSNTSPWVDDVILQTYRDENNHGGINTYDNGFVHGAGMYIHPELDPLNDEPFYCPMFAEKFSSSDRTYSCINWGVTPTPSVNRSDVLFYTQYRLLGAGVLELTYYGYNYGSETFGDNTCPWGMVRESVFPEGIRSTPSGGYEAWNGTYPTRFSLKDQGGWVGKTENINSTSAYSMSHVHGLDRHYGESWQSSASWCSVGESPLVNSTRDMTIFTAANNSIDIGPGRGFYWRTYMVIGDLETVSSTSYALVDQVDYGFVDIAESSASALMPLYKSTLDGQSVLTSTQPSSSSTPVCSTYALPVQNSVPLMLLKNNTTGYYYLSTDPQALCGKMTVDTGDVYQSYDGKTSWIALLGYVIPSSQATVTANTATLSSVLGSTYRFTAGEKLASSALLVRTDDSGTTTTVTYEAEAATFSSASTKTDSEASEGQYVDGNAGFNLTFNVSASGGEADLSFRIKAPSGSRSMGVFVNGTQVGTVTTSLNTWNHKLASATLVSGTNTIELRDSEGTAELDVDYLNVTTISEPLKTGTHQAENYTSISGCSVKSTWSGYFGSGYVDMGGNGSWIERTTVDADGGGLAKLSFRYASSTSRPCTITVNGASMGTLAFPATGGWSAWGTTSTLDVTLLSGFNTVRVTAATSAGGPNLDQIVVGNP